MTIECVGEYGTFKRSTTRREETARYVDETLRRLHMGEGYRRRVARGSDTGSHDRERS